MQKYKILVSSYACSPYRGSEPGVGWNFILGLSEFSEVHVIVEKEKWETEIKTYLETNSRFSENVKFYFIRKSRNRILRKIWPPSYYWFYRQWQREAFQLAQKLHKINSFDLIHQLNMVGFREPGYLWKMDIPFVWGPIGGLETTPWRFLPSLGLKGMLHFTGRNVFNYFQKRYLSRPKKAAKRPNNVLIAATPENQKEILSLWGKESELMAEVGCNEIGTTINKRLENEPLRIVWSGIHEPRKNLGLLLKSLAVSNIEFELHILGIGSETLKWKNLSVVLGLENYCIWYGWLSLDEIDSIYNKGHLFCITSVHDLTSTVLMEALSHGLPIICLDHCGFSSVVNESCGIKISLTKPKEAILSFSNAIQKLYLDEILREKLSEGALKRSKDFNWNNKIERLRLIYEKLVVNKSGNKQ